MSSIPISSKISQDVGWSSLESIQLKDQFISRDDYVPKVRKPYMITKQREKWTEDEHLKFIEALKLYGRTWKHIEDHVGTKTAVQIRSHAQKFFSKVVRKSSSGEVNSIEIPPPRPKRKPVHPYPRKLNLSSESIDPTAEKALRSASMSACLSVLEHENRSPTSGLSTVDTSELSTPIRSVSPLSSEFHNRSLSDLANSSPTSEEETAKILLISQDNGLTRESSVDTSSTRCLKLFGKTMIVADSHTESMSTVDICKPEMIDATDGLDRSLYKNSCSASASSASVSVGYSSFQKDSSGYLETPFPWWTLSGAPAIQVYSPIPIKPCKMPDNRDAEDGDFRKEGSSSCSNTESICLGGDEDRKSGVEAQILEISLGREKEHAYSPSRSSKTGMLKRRTSLKGFVPYKRCLAERGTHSSMITEQIEQRIRLSL